MSSIDVLSYPVATRGLLPVVGEELQVPVLGGATVRYANLDQAATAPALAAVAERVTRVLPWAGSVHRGAGLPSQVATALYEQARGGVRRFVGAGADDAVVFTRNTTDALNLLARAVPPAGGKVLFLDTEHHANLLPWRDGRHRCIEAGPTVAATLQRLRAALDATPVALVAVTGASNVTGELLPLKAIVELAHARGARVAVDAAQLAPHRRFSLQDIGADYVALSGHKLYAPFGAGALVGRRDWLDAAAPYLAGGGAVREVGRQRVDWADGEARHEAGTPNLVGAVALAEACATLADLPAGALEAHEAALRERLLAGLAQLDGVRVLTLWPDAPGAIGVVTFTVDGFEPGHVAAWLSAEHGIGLRDGRFCAHQALTRLGAPAGALRASFGIASRLEDADRLVRGLAAGPQAAYGQREGAWCPLDDDRVVPEWLGVDIAGAAPSPCARAAA